MKLNVYVFLSIFAGTISSKASVRKLPAARDNILFALCVKEYDHKVSKSSWQLISLNELESILKKNGFLEIQFWENYSKNPLDPKNSDSLLCLAKK